MKNLLQEIIDFKKYGDCLKDGLYEGYKEYLVERLLKEITVKGLVDSFIGVVFEQNEIDSEDATINVVKKLLKATQNTKYERKFGKVTPNSRTHLEITEGEFCNQETFRKEFKKFKFKDKQDLSANSLADKLLNKYLEIFDEDGWLISNVDKIKGVEIPSSTF